MQKKPFQPVRGWTTRTKQPVQYRKLTDSDLDAHKRYPETGEPTGLHFENSGKHGKVWVLKNTNEGRAVADKIDQALQKLAAKHDLQEQQAASR